MGAVTFTFDEEPDRVYQAERSETGFITLRIAVSGSGAQFIDIGGLAVTQTPPPVPEPQVQPVAEE